MIRNTFLLFGNSNLNLSFWYSDILGILDISEIQNTPVLCLGREMQFETMYWHMIHIYVYIWMGDDSVIVSNYLWSEETDGNVDTSCLKVKSDLSAVKPVSETQSPA